MAVIKNPKNKRSAAWLSRIQAARRILKTQEAKWRRNRALLLGLNPTNRSDWTAVNLAWAAFETLVGVCYAQNPEAIIRETRPDLEAIAKLLTTACQQDFELMRARNHVRLGIVDVFWAGFGCIKEHLASDITSRAYTYDIEGKTYSGSLPELTNQRYCLQRIHPSSMLRDPIGSSPDLADHKWIAEEFYPTVKEVKESDIFTISSDLLKRLPKLSNTPRLEQPLGVDQPVRNMLPEGGDDEEDDYAQIRMWEISSRVDRRLFYIPAYSDEIVGDRDWPVDLVYNKELLFPVSLLYFNEHIDESWPIAEITNIAPQLEQFAFLFKSILRDATQKWRKFVVQGEVLQKGHMARLVTGPSNQVISINPQKIGDPKTFRLDNIVYPLPDVTVKQDVLAVLGVVKNLIHEIIGSGDFAAGGFRNTRSATEAAALSDFLKVRMTTRTDALDAFFRELAIRHVLFLQQTASEERMAMLIGPDGQKVWHSYDKDEIQGDFTFHVTAGSSQPRNTEVARQEALAFYQQTLPLVVQSGGDIQPLVEWIAPFYRIPQHLVQAIFSNHKQALLQLAQAILQSHQGVQIDPQAFLELASNAAASGLSQGDMKTLASSLQQSGKRAPQPGGLPGTNNSKQTM